MTRGRKKSSSSEVAAQPDARAPLDASAFLAAATPVLSMLEADLLVRARSSAAVLDALRTRHGAEQAARRTGEDFDTWTRSYVTQVAAAWLLSCVFVRTLEDRGLLGHARIAGPGATDSEHAFFALAPSLSHREYLWMTFRELEQFAVTRELFDAAHNPVWSLGPSAEAARALVALFRTPNAEAPSFRFGGAETRFLGDLYQDLSEEVRKRYALLQTPDFVERYILDRTLDRAIAKFGLARTTLIDPTCGSGHFLLGAFARIVDAWRREEPNIEPREAARRALDAVAGADLNPYAVAIARFRLLLAFLEVGGYARLEGAPAPKMHLAVADSLLHGVTALQGTFAEREDVSAAAWLGDLYALEDEAAARDVLGRRYTAVVGNPPYITVKDAVVREEVRARYPRSAAGQYSLAAPFTERFFQLAERGGCVGMINANSFMKREFGKKLIEEMLSTVSVDGIVNTSGAYIPGHGTPTVMLFGTNEPPKGDDVLVVLAKRGEPTTPEDPAQGLVWRSVIEHGKEVGFDNEYVTVARVSRETLGKHPWSLGGGGAAELKELLEGRATARLHEAVLVIGFSVITGEDEILMGPRKHFLRHGIAAERVRRNVVGEEIRDWSLADGDWCVWPNDDIGRRLSVECLNDVLRFLWPYRTGLRARKAFGVPVEQKGIPWWALREVYSERMKTPLTITFAFVATHNHFLLDHGGKVFKQSAPIIKLPPAATEDDHLALLAYLNSSTAGFWLRQVCHSKGGQGISEGHKSEQWEQFLEFSGTLIEKVPLPPSWRSLADLGRLLSSRDINTDLDAMVMEQETLDWRVYSLFGLELPSEFVLADDTTLRVGNRPFEILLTRDSPTTQWFTRNAYALPDAEPSPIARARLDAIARNPSIAVIEQPEYKRRWTLPPTAAQREHARHRDELLAGVENEIATLGRITPERLRTTSDVHGSGLSGTALSDWIREESVPFLAAHRYTDSGLEKRAAWARTWELQRREDAGESVGAIPVPPKYDSKDYRDANAWRLRGKLDVPKERFISYPGCESDEDGEPLYGWAGWDHLQQAQALAGLYQERKEQGWERERLTPMLAGLLELLPWLVQWHNEPSEAFGGLKLGAFFDQFIDEECRANGLTRDDLRAWRPTAKRRGGKAAGGMKGAGKKAKRASEGEAT